MLTTPLVAYQQHGVDPGTAASVVSANLSRDDREALKGG
jgi:hypothetical protein